MSPIPSEAEAKPALKARIRPLWGRAAVLPGMILAVESAANPGNLKQRWTDAVST